MRKEHNWSKYYINVHCVILGEGVMEHCLKHIVREKDSVNLRSSEILEEFKI